MATTVVNGITVNKITKSQFEAEKLAGNITAAQEQNEVWLFTDDQHVSASEKETWNNKSDFSGNYEDLTNKPEIPTIPTNISAFTNDLGYLTSIPSEYVTDTELSAAISGKADSSDIPDVSGFESKTDASSKLTEAKAYTDTKVANLVNSAPTTLDTLGELATAIQENETVVDALNSAIGNKANTSDLAAVATSGSYNDLTNKPTIPTVTNDLTNALKANYDSAYAHSQSEHAPSNAQANVIETVKVNGTALTPTSKAVNIEVPTAITKIW